MPLADGWYAAVWMSRASSRYRGEQCWKTQSDCDFFNVTKEVADRFFTPERFCQRIDPGKYSTASMEDCVITCSKSDFWSVTENTYFAPFGYPCGDNGEIEILPEIVSAVRGRAEVYLDGGVRRGIDVVKALSLETKAVFVGRPALWGLAYNDVLLQIKEDILDRISCTTTRAVLALDIKGAFDNVSHTLVFENLASTGCGPRMYDYVRDFLSNWMATIGIESIRTSTIPIPSKGNRQGSVLSPTFGRQDFLEEVIETVQNYLEAGNLQRAPDKSQLLLLRAGKPIPEEEEGGHPPHRDGGAKYTVDRLVKTTTQVMRMVRRITSHRHGLEESDLIRLTQPLVVSHIACANPYLNLLSRGKGKMDVIIRKGY
ncbi:hypothetical protein ISCGN_021397 [Ixodes scapularis]